MICSRVFASREVREEDGELSIRFRHSFLLLKVEQQLKGVVTLRAIEKATGEENEITSDPVGMVEDYSREEWARFFPNLSRIPMSCVFFFVIINMDTKLSH